MEWMYYCNVPRDCDSCCVFIGTATNVSFGTNVAHRPIYNLKLKWCGSKFYSRRYRYLFKWTLFSFAQPPVVMNSVVKKMISHVSDFCSSKVMKTWFRNFLFLVSFWPEYDSKSKWMLKIIVLTSSWASAEKSNTKHGWYKHFYMHFRKAKLNLC